MKVLIIEDDKFMQAVYESALRQENIEVDIAEDGEDGLAKMKTTKPDLVLLDMILPNKNGFDILEERQQDPELEKIPVVVFSNLSQKADVDKAMALGATKYCPKGEYSVNQTVEEIKKILMK